MVNFGIKSLLAVAILALGTASAADGEPKLGIDILRAVDNCKQVAKSGDEVHVHYSGKLEKTGEVFDSSYKRERPFTFMLGEGYVIKGWDQGVVGMCIGEKRLLTIPHELGYGKRGIKKVIPPEATLVFTVELLGIGKGFKYQHPVDDSDNAKDEL
ncbi:Peptidyl-prolyl cis-trans isomerase FKBP2 [Smittium culicis]|uniref:peptidylprolyl isomerase n=1 Tax=Smittium culicis TaxID=133412 RepID=A0A1R1YKM2_9FUNG|nr:Peptidyl-prolyl cis-trans isomerase FKBP2 [Smittium culicis]OMJ27469.1 Peptidyl-prolyl cis-trans isomerase FKBP2 [Smittium culicis]